MKLRLLAVQVTSEATINLSPIVPELQRHTALNIVDSNKLRNLYTSSYILKRNKILLYVSEPF